MKLATQKELEDFARMIAWFKKNGVVGVTPIKGPALIIQRKVSK